MGSRRNKICGIDPGMLVEKRTSDEMKRNVRRRRRRNRRRSTYDFFSLSFPFCRGKEKESRLNFRVAGMREIQRRERKRTVI